MEIQRGYFIKSKFSGKLINRVHKNDRDTDFLEVNHESLLNACRTEFFQFFDDRG